MKGDDDALIFLAAEEIEMECQPQMERNSCLAALRICQYTQYKFLFSHFRHCFLITSMAPTSTSLQLLSLNGNLYIEALTRRRMSSHAILCTRLTNGWDIMRKILPEPFKKGRENDADASIKGCHTGLYLQPCPHSQEK